MFFSGIFAVKPDQIKLEKVGRHRKLRFFGLYVLMSCCRFQLLKVFIPVILRRLGSGLGDRRSTKNKVNHIEISYLGDAGDLGAFSDTKERELA